LIDVFVGEDLPTTYDEQKCTITVSTIPEEEFCWLCLIAIAGVIPLIILLIVGILIYYYYSSYLHQLPSEISWSFLNKLTHPWLWNTSVSGSLYYYNRGIKLISQFSFFCLLYYNRGKKIISQFSFFCLLYSIS
jgi:hypothetical protein